MCVKLGIFNNKRLSKSKSKKKMRMEKKVSNRRELFGLPVWAKADLGLTGAPSPPLPWKHCLPDPYKGIGHKRQMYRNIFPKHKPPDCRCSQGTWSGWLRFACIVPLAEGKAIYGQRGLGEGGRRVWERECWGWTLDLPPRTAHTSLEKTHLTLKDLPSNSWCTEHHERLKSSLIKVKETKITKNNWSGLFEVGSIIS